MQRSLDARLALAAGILMTLALVALHIHSHRHVGGLWRDEVNSVNLVQMPTFTEVVANLGLDSFPLGWAALLRLWTDAGLGDTDAGLRRFGLLIGLMTIGVLWWTGWRLGIGPPLVSLLLCGLSPSIVLYGDEVRGYGIAALGIAWSFGATWALLERPDRRRFLVAQLAALVATQVSFANCVLFAAIGVAAAVVCLRRRDWPVLRMLIALGTITSVLLFGINVPTLRAFASAAPIEQAHYWSYGWLLQVFGHSLGPGALGLSVAWAIAATIAVAGFVVGLYSPATEKELDRLLYTLLSWSLGFVVTFAIYGQLRIPTQYWHYLSVIIVSALACEIGVRSLVQRIPWGEHGRVGLVVLGLLMAIPAVWETLNVRLTNLDVIAAELNVSARPDDLIVVFPWYCGITFQRYYRGRAAWITIPDFEEHKFHRHHLVAEKMKAGEAAVEPDLARVEATLRRGGKVWIVGVPEVPVAGQPLDPLPREIGRVSAGIYLQNWELQFGSLIAAHGRDRLKVPLPDVGPINAWENLPLLLVEGWK